jgi:hypothetical protein
MNKLIVLVIVTVIILIINYVYVTNEGFTDSTEAAIECNHYGDSIIEENCSVTLCGIHKTNADCPTDSCIWDTDKNKCVDNNNDKDSDCSVINSLIGDKFKINTVCPYSPECMGICLNDFTFTKENLPYNNVTPYNSLINNLKINVDGIDSSLASEDQEDQSHLFVSSRCFECVKNFYKITELLLNNSCGY